MRMFFSPRISALAVVFGAVLGATAMAGSANAANPLELNFWLSGPRYDGNMGQCESALSAISAQFAQKEGRFWNSDLRITGFADVREVAYRPWEGPNSAYNAIPRRFCSASAMLNDGHPRMVHYSIIEDGGFAGTGLDSGVEWCVVGLDRNWAYNPRCRSAKP
ncbi:MAG: hypothetical protein K2W78_03045 [Xanthobacteraceae bacterium]|nr:hypothetical protein [Xanthobacteraceae bacterium]